MSVRTFVGDLVAVSRLRLLGLDVGRMMLDLIIVSGLGLGFAFSAFLIEAGSRWTDSSWTEFEDVSDVLLADRSFLLSCSLALAIPVERAVSNLMIDLPLRRLNIAALVVGILLVVVGLGIAAGATDYLALSQSEYVDMVSAERQALDNSRSLNLGLAFSLLPLVFLTSLSRAMRP